MEHTNTHTCRNKSSQLPSPSAGNLLRSKSGSHAAMSSPYKIYPCTTASINSSQRFGNSTSQYRSKSTTKSRNKEDSPRLATTKTTSQDQSNGGGSFVNKFLQRGAAAAKSNKKAASAWALSPGRGSAVVPDHHYSPVSSGGGPMKAKSGGGGGMNGVLKYFRQNKKVCLVQEEEFHRFKIMHSRLLQWRFVNARAAASMAASKRVAEERLLSVGFRIWKMRRSITENRMMEQKLKHEIKVCLILNPQIRLLNEWAKLERKNCESVGRVVRKLCGISVRLPLLDDAKGDVESVVEAMGKAVEVMGGIEQVVKQYLNQVEKLVYILTELTITIKQEEECVEELEKTVPLLATSVVKEETLRAHLLQAKEE